MTRLTIAAVAACISMAAADIDNDSVHVLNALVKPRQKTALHEHVFNRVIVYLDAGHMEVRHEDGRIEEQHWKKDQVVWAPAGGRHTSENMGDSPMRVIEVELKKTAPATSPVRTRELDPVVLDPKHNILLFENDQVRVFRSWREPGGVERMHEHTGAGRVAVLLTPIDADVKSSDGTVTPLHAVSGDVLWSPPTKHSATNTGSRRFEMIVVEVK